MKITINEEYLRQTIRTSLNEGTWGYSPLESDHALDFRDDLYAGALDSVVDKMNGTTDSNYLYAYLGTFIELVQILLQTNFPVFLDRDKGKYDKAVKRALDLIKKDKKWQTSWSEPEKITPAIEKTEREYKTVRKKHTEKWGK